MEVNSSVADVKSHRGDLCRHRGFDALPAGDDRMCGIHPRPHFIEVDIHGIHRCGEVLHVSLARQDNAPYVIDLSNNHPIAW